MADHGPYESEQQASAAARAAIPPAPGHVILSWSQLDGLLHLALAESGVETTAYEDGTVGWLANYEDSTVQVIAGWIRRAYEAGKAARPETAAEWGTRFIDEDGREHMGANFGTGLQAELFARGLAAAGKAPDWRGITVTREVTPWTPAPEEEAPDD